MSVDRRSLSIATRFLMVATLVLLVAPTGAFAATPQAAPALESPQLLQGDSEPSDQIARDVTTTGCSETALATPAVAGSLPVLSVEDLLSPTLVPNPCYQFDDPSTGCYYKWRPSDYCCVSPSAWCPSICY